MKLAVIAHSLDARPTGRGVVARELVPALQRVRPDIDIHLFAGEDPHWPEVTFSCARGGGFWSSAWRMAGGIARDIRRIQPDALWCATHLLPGGLPRDLPVVATLLDVVWRDEAATMAARHRVVAKIGERGLQRANTILCISGFTRDRLIHHWPLLGPKSRVMHLAPGTGSPPTCQSSSVRQPTVVNVGTLEPRKNLGVLLDAMGAMPDLSLVQCGSAGWNVAPLLQRARAMRNVELRGYASAANVSELYASATAAVFPSVYEGFHLPPLEAMAHGCPVLASDIPVHREVLGDAALYFAPHDRAAIAALIRRVAHDEVERQRVIEAGRQRAARYSWAASAKVLAACVDALLETRAS